jgi:hypothetical protein
MRTFEIGLVLPMGESFDDGSTARWSEIRELACRAEEIGFDDQSDAEARQSGTRSCGRVVLHTAAEW